MKERFKAKPWTYGLIGLCILLLLVLLAKSKVGKSGILRIEFSDLLSNQAKTMYLTGLHYSSMEQPDGWEEWMAFYTRKLLPVNGFVRGQGEKQEIEDEETVQKILASQANDENAIDENGKLIGTDQSALTRNPASTINMSPEKMKDFDYLLSNFYTVDGTTMIRSDELRGDELIAKDMHINTQTPGPKILIYHTHSQEMFLDSVPGDTETSIVGVGNYLTQLLEETYHIPTLHHTGVYDLINGKLDRSKAYDLAKPEIARILEENPSIEVVIDLHRDGVGETTHLVTDVNGKPTAQIMFFNGLSKTRANGEINYLANPYIQDNLAFSLQMQMESYRRYPGFARRIYLRGYRYNMHMAPKTLLIEAGAQTNTLEEMKNAMDLVADLLHAVLVE